LFYLRATRHGRVISGGLITLFRPKGMALPVVIVTLPSLAIYDQIAATVGEAA
jgi:hypothetical protein